MDMKRILQAMDGVATKPVAGADSMAKFLSIIDKNNVRILKEEQNNNTVLNEGKTPHKVTLPVQMAMQHYQKVEETIKAPSLLKKYFAEAEEEIVKEKEQRKALLNQYASVIAERVQLKNKSGN
jgi:hypothetical protein